MKTHSTEQSFYFFLSVWGKSYRKYFSEFCLPSLLSPGNIPSLPQGAHKLLIACPQCDWHSLEGHPAIVEARKYLAVEHIDIPEIGEQDVPTLHMGLGHKLATIKCFEDAAFGVALSPDLIMSDGAIRFGREKAKLGNAIVFVPALRFDEHALMKNLNDWIGENSQERQNIISIPPRELLTISLFALHPETEALFIEENLFVDFSILPAIIWRVPGKRGFVIRSLSWLPLVIDYRRISLHDNSVMDRWTIDGSYIHDNFGIPEKYYPSCDSDEVMVVSWTPAGTFRPGPFPSCLRNSTNIKKKFNQARARLNYWEPVFDDLKRECFQRKVRWHVDAIDDAWLHYEKAAVDYFPVAVSYKDKWAEIGWAITHFSQRLVILFDAVIGRKYARDIVKGNINLLRAKYRKKK